MSNSLPASYFEQVYADAADPWGFGSRWYESRKYALTLAALPQREYRRGLEPGCSIGVLTEGLAQRCEQLVATDVVDSVLDAAATRLRTNAPDRDVRLCRWGFGDPWTLGTFDLVVISEIGYYLSVEALRAAMADVVANLDTDGTVIAVHWQHHVDDYPLTGAEVHAIIRAAAGLTLTGQYRDDDMMLDVFVKSSAPKSVAAVAGLA